MGNERTFDVRVMANAKPGVYAVPIVTEDSIGHSRLFTLRVEVISATTE